MGVTEYSKVWSAEVKPACSKLMANYLIPIIVIPFLTYKKRKKYTTYNKKSFCVQFDLI